MIEIKKHVTPGETPAEITISMIDQDLKDGISKSEMTIKYGIKPWEVDEMFKHPFLKGRRPSRKKSLSFTFVDDTDEALIKKSTSELLEGIIEPEVDPNQVTLEQAIEEATTVVDESVKTFNEVSETVNEILSDPEFEVPTFEDTMDLVEEQQEEELELDDNSFSL
jgi:hypothetical protein